MFEQAIEKQTKRVLGELSRVAANGFCLAGGTALAIQLGHRKSIDLDWFCSEGFDGDKIKLWLSQLDEVEIVAEEEGTIHALIAGVKVSFFDYPYPLIFPLLTFEGGQCNGVKLADKREIAAMKLDAISSRGSKKDFVDLFFLLKEFSLTEIFTFFEKKYYKIKFNKLHMLRSLTYFELADSEPMPVMLEAVDWEEVKRAIKKKTRDYLEKEAKE